MDKHGFREIQKKLKLTNEGVSEAMDVELFTIQQWASGVWPIPNAMAKFLRTLLSANRDMTSVYMSGHHRGRNSGLREGRLDAVEDCATGYDTGFSEGYGRGGNDGYAAGKQKGYTYGLEDSSDTRKKGYTEGYIAAMKAVGIF